MTQHITADLTVHTEPGRPASVTVPDLADLPARIEWLTETRDALRDALDRHGALMVRGLGIASSGDFAAVRDTLLPERTPYREKATPRSAYGDDVFSSTDLPPGQRIRMHNENSYTLTFPGVLLFACLVEPATGGATPVADCRQVLRSLPVDLVARFRANGWRLIRNYGDTLSLDWRTAFGAETRADVERYCADNLISVEWGPEDTLRTTQRRSAIITHPRTREEVWFNHAAFWSEWSLDPEVREVLVGELGRQGLPFVTQLGDGSELSEQDVAALNRAYEDATVRDDWHRGDLLVVDNLLSTHGREAFTGRREIVVAMGQPVALSACSPTVGIEVV